MSEETLPFILKLIKRIKQIIRYQCRIETLNRIRVKKKEKKQKKKKNKRERILGKKRKLEQF